jgi:hypothetical protein
MHACMRIVVCSCSEAKFLPDVDTIATDLIVGPSVEILGVDLHNVGCAGVSKG